MSSTDLKMSSDSAFRMNNGAYLRSDLTSHEIDSIMKCIAAVNNKFYSSPTVADAEFTDATGFIHLPVSSNVWRAMGKDHRRLDPSKITAYAIGIENISYPNVGYLQVNSNYVVEYVPSGNFETTSIDVPAGWGLTCSAGQVTYNSSGRFIIRNYPFIITNSIFESGYNSLPDAGYNYSWALMIQGEN